MRMDKKDYYAIIRAGIDPEYHRDLDGFAEACFDNNLVQELLDALKEKRACRKECDAWGITPSIWRESLKFALSAKAFYYELDNNFSDVE